ncbi:kinase-like protein [Hypoxylon sp. EC38]|nr:kinase-like protein [Hypoxylon sp. EC38]
MSHCNGENKQSSDSASPTRDSRIEYDEIASWVEVEDVQLYNKGGFHPVHIGDILAGKFEVVHKLGYGGFSTVWLCLDVTNQKWRAVKIMTADHSSKERDNEIVDHLLREASLKQLQDCHIAIPHERFWIEGPNGRHLCFVTDVYGLNAFYWSLHQDPTKETTEGNIINVCYQIIKGVHFLHSKGICHGDLKPGNILAKLRSLDGLTKDQMLELTGEPDLFEFDTVSGEDPGPHAPEYCVSRITTYWFKHFLSDSIVIGDFGESFHINSPPKTTGIPALYAAPEILFEGVPGPASDIWSLACTIYEVRTHDLLFASLWGSGMRDLLGAISSYIGPLPEPYKSSQDQQSTGVEGVTIEPSTRKDDYPCPFEESIGIERCFSPNRENLPPEQVETFKYRFRKEEVSMLADLLKKMLRYDPVERIGIDAVIRHPWVNGTPKENSPAGEPKSIWTLGLSLTSLRAFSRRYLPGYANWKSS